MIESFVDLTYRGLFLGRRIKLTQVRPNSGTLELAAPMPVGTHVAITADDGVTFDATVSWVYEQVAGTERTPGMVVVPVLAADPALSWWKARVELPDEDSPKPRVPRSRPMTQRTHSRTVPAPPPEEALTEPEIPAIISDLDARVAAAAGIVRSGPAAAPGEPGDRRTTEMTALDQEELMQPTRSSDAEQVVRQDEHAVAMIDDDHKTMRIASLDSSGDPGANAGPEGDEAGGAGEG